MSAPIKLPDTILSWLNEDSNPEELSLRYRWWQGSLGAGIILFLWEGF